MDAFFQHFRTTRVVRITKKTLNKLYPEWWSSCDEKCLCANNCFVFSFARASFLHYFLSQLNKLNPNMQQYNFVIKIGQDRQKYFFNFCVNRQTNWQVIKLKTKQDRRQLSHLLKTYKLNSRCFVLSKSDDNSTRFFLPKGNRDKRFCQ